MPRRRRGFGLGRNSQQSIINRRARDVRTESQHERDNEEAANRMSEARSSESPEQGANRRQENASRIRQARTAKKALSEANQKYEEACAIAERADNKLYEAYNELLKAKK